jgi:hypothetical protein
MVEHMFEMNNRENEELPDLSYFLSHIIFQQSQVDMFLSYQTLHNEVKFFKQLCVVIVVFDLV